MDLTKVVVAESDRRCSAERLKEMLTDLPLEIEGPGLKLRAFMGLGKIVYVQPQEGEITEIKFTNAGAVLDTSGRYGNAYTIRYNGQRFEVQKR